MTDQPDDLRYTKTHEWVRVLADCIEVGITDFAQRQLSDITYIQLPQVPRHVRANEEVLTLESIKAASDVYAPISGTIIEVHTELEKTPELINSDPYTEGWLFRMEFDDMNEVDALMSSEEYSATLQPEE